MTKQESFFYALVLVLKYGYIKISSQKRNTFVSDMDIKKYPYCKRNCNSKHLNKVFKKFFHKANFNAWSLKCQL